MGSLSQPSPSDSGQPMALGRALGVHCAQQRARCNVELLTSGANSTPVVGKWLMALDHRAATTESWRERWLQGSHRSRTQPGGILVVREAEMMLKGSRTGSFYYMGKRKTWWNDLDTRSVMNNMMGRSLPSMVGGARMIQRGQRTRRSMMAQPRAKQPHNKGD
jgi:hypothetical protein